MGEGELNEIALRLHVASVGLSRMFRSDEAGGLSPRRESALATLAIAGPMSLAGLAEAEHVRPPTMSRVVDALVEAGLASRDTAPGDRRGIRVAVTPKGDRMMRAARDRRARLLGRRLSKLADSELRALARGVEVLVMATR